MRRTAALFLVIALAACAQMPSQPRDTMLSAGVWNGDACLSVAQSSCNLIVGCGHGVFPQPTLLADGTFEVEGTYRVEVGPVGINPAPPAAFSGVVRGQALTLTVTPQNGSPMTYVLQLTVASGGCVSACV